MKKEPKKGFLIPRLLQEAVDKLRRGKTIKSEKVYNRKRDKRVKEGEE